MRLADHIRAARGTFADVGMWVTSMSAVLDEAEVFDVDDTTAISCGELVYSRPSSLLAALPLCRTPFEKMFIECRGGLGQHQDTRKKFDDAPVPWKQGYLVEAIPGGQTGIMSFAWMHTGRDEMLDAMGVGRHAVSTTPVGVLFDWRPDADVRDLVRTYHRHSMDKIDDDAPAKSLIEGLVEVMERRWLEDASTEQIACFMTGLSGWKGLAKDAKEIEALHLLDHHMIPCISRHGAATAVRLMSAMRTSAEMRHLITQWQADMQGEATWVQCFLAMLNSRNRVVEHEPVDVTRLNKARRKSGKPEFLPYRKTRLAMSRSQGRIADAHGIAREVARQHLVRGHFKIRKSGVYWWSPFLRGDPARGEMKRESYDVMGARRLDDGNLHDRR